MRAREYSALVVIAACGAAEPPPANRAVPPQVAAPEQRCLPVVATDCGCVYDCGIGVRDGDHWNVTHAFWHGSTLRARVAPWCVDGRCTTVFAAEIVCDGVCAPKPADPKCTCPTAR